jgi:hypothetical protein
MISHKFKLRNVHNYSDNLWSFNVRWTNGHVWNCETRKNGRGVFLIEPEGDITNITQITSPAKFTLANCTRSQVYRRIHKVFDKMKVPKPEIYYTPEHIANMASGSGWFMKIAYDNTVNPPYAEEKDKTK